jgi:hypothetical protein
MTTSSFEHCSDEDLMNRLFELYEHADEHADELAALDQAIQARLAATYTPEPGHSPRNRIAA